LWFFLVLCLLLGEACGVVGLVGGCVMFGMVVGLLNTGMEPAIGRIGTEWQALSQRGKDMGRAAVLLSLLLCLGIWAAAIWKFIHG